MNRLQKFARRHLWIYWQQWLGRNAISVRCALSHRSLWFYLPEAITSHSSHLWLPLERAVHAGSNDLDGITPEGQALIRAIRSWPEVVDRGIDLRPDYIAVHVHHEEDWREVIPRIVGLIRYTFPRPDLRVRVMPPFDPAVPVWHRQLLEELCGPLAP